MVDKILINILVKDSQSCVSERVGIGALFIQTRHLAFLNVLED